VNLTNQYPSLANKIILISGGATSIGANLVEAFCLQKAQVFFIDIQDAPAQALIHKISAISDATIPTYFHCDLVNIERLKDVFTTIKNQVGPISVLVNNAANDQRHDFKNLTVAEWDNRINVNLRHAFFAIQFVYEHMKQLGGGSVINMGSFSWYDCHPNMTGYTTAKAGIEGLTRGLARELGADNIRINSLIPGWVMTERQLLNWVNEDTLKYIQASQSIKASLMPSDISAMALFLASDDSRMCTAQKFVVDGGWISNPTY
jgi:D-xylose 1-dehydrogenase